MCTEFLTAAGALYERERSNGERAGAVEEVLREKRLAGAEDDSRVSQCSVNSRCERVCTTEHAPRDPFRLFERRNGLAEIVERGARVLVERDRISSIKILRPKHHRDPAKFAALNRNRAAARWALRQIPAYVDAVAAIRRRPGADRLPILIITAIGKPGHEVTQWVVKEFVRRLRLPAGIAATQGAVAGAVGREVAAAAELGVLRGAAHAVLVTGSTFSEVAMRWRTQSNQSAPVVVRLI